MTLRDDVIQQVLRDPSALASIVPRGIAQRSINTPLVTALPVSPRDADEVHFLADATKGVVWHLRYRANAPSDYRWEFVGGSPLWATVTTSQSTNSTSFTDLTTTGPSIALPFGGDYMVRGGAKGNNDTDARGGMMSYAIGASAAVDADALAEFFQSSATSVTATNSREARKTGLGAVTLTAKYRATTGGNAFFIDRWMSVTPVRLGRN